MNNKKWISAHLFYSDNLHKFLVDAVKPFKESVLKDGLAENYFYIRYWEKGPHIRLRFRGNSDVLNRILKPKIHDYFNKYYLKFPSARAEDKKLENNNAGKDIFFPNNSVQFIDYEPEIERYGGNKGLFLSEKIFEMSSDACLEILSNTDLTEEEYNGERAIGAAIQLHLAGLVAFQYSRNDISFLFENIFNEWMPAAYRVFSGNNTVSFTSEERILHKDCMINVFNKQSIPVKPILKPFLNDYFEALKEELLFEEKWINNWINNMKSIYYEINKYINTNEIIIPDWYKNRTLVKDKIILNYLNRSYIHMTNNRIGVLNHNESYIAFLIKEFLKN